MIGRSGERGSGISVLVAWHDDDIYIYILKKLCIFTYYCIIALSQILSTLQIISHFVCHKPTKRDSHNQHCQQNLIFHNVQMFVLGCCSSISNKASSHTTEDLLHLRMFFKLVSPSWKCLVELVGAVEYTDCISAES